MINTLKIIFFVITKYFLIDFIFICAVLFFPEYTFYFLQWFFSILTQIFGIPFIGKFPLDSFAFTLFCITWSFRKRRLFNEGFTSNTLTHKQIFGRFFIVLTFFAMYVDKFILNDPALQMEIINDKTTLFFELLFCWVIAMIVVEIFSGIIFKLFRL
jgi:hypothetical protein